MFFRDLVQPDISLGIFLTRFSVSWEGRDLAGNKVWPESLGERESLPSSFPLLSISLFGLLSESK